MSHANVYASRGAQAPRGAPRGVPALWLLATSALLAGCGTSPADDGGAIDAAASTDLAAPWVAPDPPADGRYTYTFHRGVPGTLYVPHVESPLYGFRLTLDGDEFDEDTLTVTVSAAPFAPGGMSPHVLLEPHGTAFRRPAVVQLPLAQLPNPKTDSEERLVVLRRRPSPGAPEELVTDTLAYAFHPVSGWYQVAPLRLRGGPTPVSWTPNTLGPNGTLGQALNYPRLLRAETLGFSEIWAEFVPRNTTVLADAIWRGAPCETDADCNDGMACSTDQCVTFEGGKQCAWTWALPGAPCDDGDASTVDDRCRKYLCSGVDVECTRDSDCADDNLCAAERCDAGRCVAGAPVSGSPPCIAPSGLAGRCKAGGCAELSCKSDADCDDGQPCTLDRCEAERCVTEALAGACDDGDPITDGDVCSDGLCSGVATYCAPTAALCPGSGGCATTTCATLGAVGYCATAKQPDGSSCDDGDPNTDGDHCSAGLCRGTGAECTCAEGTLAAPGCSWSDATQCTGWVSALCYESCGGWSDTACFEACHDGADARGFPSGATYTAEDCHITLTCP